MDKRRMVVVVYSLCAVLALTAQPFRSAYAQSKPAGATQVKPIELSFTTVVAPTHTRWTGSIAPWIKMVEERSGGKVKIVPYFAETLAKGSETYEAISQGIADMGEVSTSHSPGRFRLTDLFNLPGLAIQNSVVSSRLHYHLIQTVPEFAAQCADVKVITAYSHGGAANCIMSRVPVHTLEDLKGKKLNIYGGPIGVGIAKALGFTPINMSIPDVYLAVEKGVMDGVISSVSLITSRKFGEIMKRVTSGPTLGGAPFIIVMNPAKWGKLPPDVQKAFNDLGGMYGAEFFGKGMVNDETEARQDGARMFGVEFYTLPAAELARWNKRLEPVQEDWVKSMESKGLAARKVFEEYKRFVQKAK